MAKDRQTRARETRQKEKTGSSYTGPRGGFTETKQVGDRYKADVQAAKASGKSEQQATKEAQEKFMDRGRSQYQDVRTDGGVSTLVDPRKVTEEKKKEQYDAIEDFYDPVNKRWDIRKARQNIPLLQQLTGRKIAQIRADGTIIFADELGGKARFMKLADALNQIGAKLTGFDPTKALTEGGMGDQGKAALWNKLSDMKDPEEFQAFLNRKGNLDRILEFGRSGQAGDPRFDMTEVMKSGGKEYLMGLLESTGGEDFQMLKLKNSSKKSDREKYWAANPPRTQGDLEEAAMAGVPGAREEWSRIKDRQDANLGGIASIGEGGALPPTDPTTDPTKVPDYVLKQQYMPGFTPSYTGGPEQMHIAGGYWDPVTKKWIGGGGPWGTTGQYQFPPPQVTTMAQGGIVGTSPLLFKNQGGMVNDGGIKAFKKYGY